MAKTVQSQSPPLAADPPRPNVLLLGISVALWFAWLGFLIWLAWQVA